MNCGRGCKGCECAIRASVRGEELVVLDSRHTCIHWIHSRTLHRAKGNSLYFYQALALFVPAVACVGCKVLHCDEWTLQGLRGIAATGGVEG